MNNKERLFWLSGIVFISFLCLNKMDQIENLKILDRTNNLSHRIQADQINELENQLKQVEDLGYNRGFQEGESHALISSFYGKNLYNYADGYHAALLQFANDNDSNMNEDTYALFNKLLKMLESSNEN
jgi:hypothetical protein